MDSGKAIDAEKKVGIARMKYSHRQNYGKKQNVSIYRRRLSMIEKLRTFFFHNNFSIIIFFHNSVGAVMSIDSQFECILRGNIEL